MAKTLGVTNAGKTEPWQFVVLGRRAQEEMIDLTLKVPPPCTAQSYAGAYRCSACLPAGMLAPDKESHLLHCGCSACYLVPVCRWFTVSPEPPDTVQVLEEVLPTYDFEAKRAKINGKRTRDYPRVPVRGPSAPS